MPMSNHALTLSLTDQHFTPAWLMEKIRAVLGEIDLDPCSSAEANATVKARCYFTEGDGALVRPWWDSKTVYINPPGDSRGKGPKLFWKKLSDEIGCGRVDRFVWLAFSVSQLRTLQAVDKQLLSECRVCVLKDRVRFTGKSPVKDSAVLYWHEEDRGTLSGRDFYDVFGELGLILEGRKY